MVLCLWVFSIRKWFVWKSLHAGGVLWVLLTVNSQFKKKYIYIYISKAQVVQGLPVAQAY